MKGGGKQTVVSDEEEYEEEDVNAETIDEENDDEEEEEGQDEYEKDGFIVDDAEEEEDEGKSQKKKKKKKRLRDSERNFVLDEEDYDLLEDNISGFHRPKASTKFKRLKKAGRDTEKGVFGSLFDDVEEGLPPEDITEEDERPADEELAIGEDDEMADFIVDEEESEIGQAPSRQRKKKKKNVNRVSGVSVAALAEAQDIFGDVDELLELRKRSLSRSGMSDDSEREKKLENEYEPSILVEKYLTEKDDQMRQIDLPERMQISEESTGPPPVDERSLRDESFWIHSQLSTISWIFQKKDEEGADKGCLSNKIDKEDILRFLKLHHVDKYDIPFIASYRKEQCLSLLEDIDCIEIENEKMNKTEGKPRLKWHKLLWAVKDLDRKWLLLQKRKSILNSYYKKRYEAESRRIYNEERLSLNQQIFESITNSLKCADTEREVDDVDLKFNLHFPPGEVDVDEGQFKRPKKKSLYSICGKVGLWGIAEKFGLNSEQFGLQITLEKVRMEVAEDLKESPEEIASNFTCSLFGSPEAVLKGARHMAATEISFEPCFRKHVRSIFMDKAEVSTKPTPEGNKAIDFFHQYARVKWLSNKPLYKFEDAQWLLIEKGEEEKLLQVTLKLPENILNTLMDEANVCYLSDGVSISARLWNEQRRLILQDAILKFLLPSMEKEARTVLTARAKKWLAMEYGKQLWARVSVAPFYAKRDKLGPDEESLPRVMACCWGPGNPPTTCVMLDSLGELVDVLSVGSINVRSNDENNKPRLINDQQRVYNFLTDHQPDVVVLGAANLSCIRLKENIFEVIFKMVEENPRAVDQAMDGINIYYGDEALPRVYEHSPISSCQLPGQSGIVKRAVALGRFLQNPLAMVATLCGAGREIVSWKIDSLEHFLTSDDKYEMIEEVMVDASNQVGVDVNLAASHDWLFAPLQFVSGLGPRKAVSLQRALVKAGAVRNRKELTFHGLNTKKVFINAIGFLRIRSSGLLASNGDEIDILDDTRIHPESYGLAEVLAKTVYEHYVQGDDDAEPDLAIEYVRNNQGQLESFDIDLYAQDNRMINERETLRDIKLELLHGFQDWRKPCKEPTPDEAFGMISGENEYSLAEGRTVHVTVCHVQVKRAYCVLDSGLTGVLLKEDYIEDGDDDFELPERLHEGDALSCKIKNVERNRYQVFLTCKDHRRSQVLPDVDPYYHEDVSKLSSQPDEVPKDKNPAKDQFMQRMITHPHFQNMAADEAIEILSNKGAGACIIRPSSRGLFDLTLTLKIYDGVYAHKDITEWGKDHMDITSLLRIGKTLKIGDESFEDLDEVMDRYVDPLVTYLKAMLSYRKFRTGTKSEVDELLRAEKSDYPKRIVYCFGISYEHPGTFILSYIRNINPHHEYVGLHPKGFKFRKRTFDNIDQLVAYFQRHIDDSHRMPPPSAPSAIAAMVPMISYGTRSRNDWAPGGGDSHPSGRDSNDKRGNESKDFGYGTTSTWQSKSSQGGGSDNGLSKFPGAKVQNSPAKETSRTGWGSNETTAAGSGGRNWGSGNIDDHSNSGNWGGGSTGILGSSSSAGGGNWGGGSSHGWGGGSSGGWGSGSAGGGASHGGSSSVLGSGGNWGGGSCTKIKDYGFGKAGSDDGWSKFPGTKVENSPGREAFPGGWGSGISSNEQRGGGWSDSGGGWGSKYGNSGGGSWGGSAGGSGEFEQGRGRGWESGLGCGDFEQGRGRGRGRGSGRGGGSNYGSGNAGDWSEGGRGSGDGNAGGGSQGGWSAGGDRGRGWEGGRGRGRGRDSGSYYGRGDGSARGGNWGGGSTSGGGRGWGRGRGRGRRDSSQDERNDSTYSFNSKWGSKSNEGSGGGWSSGWGGGSSWGGGGGTSDINDGKDKGSGGWGGSSTAGNSAASGGSGSWGGGGVNKYSSDRESGGWGDKSSGGGWVAGHKDSNGKESGGWDDKISGNTGDKTSASGGSSWGGKGGSGWAAGDKSSKDGGSGGWGGSSW